MKQNLLSTHSSGMANPDNSVDRGQYEREINRQAALITDQQRLYNSLQHEIKALKDRLSKYEKV
ncbi:MAG: hypothetical protein LE169_04135 [Endomicrobium sp.]|nr:hypothetical protein [Endomicrobium sp.]